MTNASNIAIAQLADQVASNLSEAADQLDQILTPSERSELHRQVQVYLSIMDWVEANR